MQAKTLHAQILALLERERSAILAGNFAALEKFSAEKDALLRRLKKKPDGQNFSTLGILAKRNDALLAAAAQGIRQTLTRLQNLQTQAGRLETYAPDGSRNIHSTKRGQLERRR